ncbi:DUF1405 domain-containing protein [Candidatus Micrarchaeota archaeon]|nr:DUF1405 domain-containing protein [Candidatus Micrarchaeota archaeon]
MNKLIQLFIIANLIGFAFGIYYYWNQLLSTNPLLWLLVIDCPLFALMAAITYWKKTPDWFKQLTAIGCLKYGLWTVIVIIGFSNYYFTPETALLYAALLIAHFGLAVQGLFFIGTWKKNYYLLATGFFVANDLSDYFLSTHPAAIPLQSIETIKIFTILLSIATIGFGYYFNKKTNFFAFSKELTEAKNQIQ